ncbi:type II secretion system protein GspG [Microbulbifer sp. TYP-18]
MLNLDSQDEMALGKSDAQLIDLSIYDQALNMVFQDVGSYPSNEIGFRVLYANELQHKNWNGPYLGREMKSIDQWGNPLIYRYPSKCGMNSKKFDLYSRGPNGIDECGIGDDVTKK